MEHLCENCKYTREPASGEHCRNCAQNAVDNFKPMTNADRIRNMTNKELADFLASNPVCENCQYHNGLRCEFDNVCVKDFAAAMALEWLRSPVDGKNE